MGCDIRGFSDRGVFPSLVPLGRVPMTKPTEPPSPEERAKAARIKGFWDAITQIQRLLDNPEECKTIVYGEGVTNEQAAQFESLVARIRDAERRGEERMRERAARDCERDHIKPAFEAGWDAVHTYGQPLLESNLLHTLYMRGYKQALIDAAGGIRALPIGEGK